MCFVSAVINEAMGHWPLPWQMPIINYKPYLEAVDEARKLDEVNGEPFCSTPEKAKWQKDFEILMCAQFTEKQDDFT